MAPAAAVAPCRGGAQLNVQLLVQLLQYKSRKMLFASERQKLCQLQFVSGLLCLAAALGCVISENWCSTWCNARGRGFRLLCALQGLRQCQG